MGDYVYGIDLGTTYSCVAYLDENGKAVTCKNKLGENTTPSVIQMVEGKAPLVGKPAKDTAVLEPENTIAFAKNFIGRKDPDTGEFIKLPYGQNGEEISPVDVSAEILKVLAREAGEYLERSVEKVVITCPAYFSAERREATKEAGRRAGLDVLAIIEEPTAAALAYGVGRGEDMLGKTVLIYDLGGGTFDITVMKIEADEEGKAKYTVLCTEGDHDLGGGKWDSAIYDYAYSEWEAKNSPSEEMEAEAQQDLSIRSEDAKKALTNMDSYTIGIVADEGRAKVVITKEQFEDFTKNLLESTINLTKKAIANVQGFAFKTDDTGAEVEKGLSEIINEFDSKYDKSQIAKILLVGGSTLMPQVERAVKEAFGIDTISFEPHEAVAHGAAIFAGLSSDEVKKHTEEVHDNSGNGNSLEDVKIGGGQTGSVLPVTMIGQTEEVVNTISPKSYGIKILRGGDPAIMNMIKKGTVLPVEYTATIPLSASNLATCDIELFEADNRDDFYGVDEVPSFYNKSIKLPPNCPAGTDVDIVTSVDKQGMFSIHVKVAGEELNDDFDIKIE